MHLSVLDGNQVHPTAEAGCATARQQTPMMSLNTVYQTLNGLAEMGEIQQLDLGTGSSRFDPNVEGIRLRAECREGNLSVLVD
jgi:Fur family peroxide stress response transcriptional regulator